MGPGDIFLLLATAGTISLWSWAAYRAYQQGNSAGLTIFFFHLIGAVAAVGLAWLIVVYPNADCIGELCGIEYWIGWMVISLILLVVWPLILVVHINRKYPRKEKKRKSNENILDEDIT